MQIGVTGAEGRVGSELVKNGCVPLNADITEFEEIKEEIDKVKPSLIIHCAGMGDVDYCESHPLEASKVNIRGTAEVATASEGIPKIVISTDYVFNGKRGPYSERAKSDPVNEYGFTKLGAEAVGLTIRSHETIIVRTSRLFREDDKQIMYYIDLLRNGRKVYVPSFMYRSFLYIPHFVDGLLYIAMNFETMPWMLHVAGTETLSWYEFMLAVGNLCNHDKRYIMPRTEKLTALTPRPYKGGLKTGKARKAGVPLYSAYDGIKEIGYEWRSFHSDSV